MQLSKKCSSLFSVLSLLVNSLLAYQEDWPTTRISSDEPEFLAPIHNLTIPVGREAVLSCSVSNLGRYKVAWVRAEDQTILSLHTKVVTHNSRISVTHDSQRTWQIRIRQLKESDRGCYMCQINTSVLKIQQGCIDVNVPPDIVNDDTSGDLSVLEGENTTLWCRASGHPPPRIAWKREDGHPIIIRKGQKEITEVFDKRWYKYTPSEPLCQYTKMNYANWCFYLFMVVLFMWQHTTADGKRLHAPVYTEEDCGKPVQEGPASCLAYITRYRYSTESGRCEKAIYGGCFATRNNFPSLEKCEEIAVPICSASDEDSYWRS